jgi:hypothetical protein
MGKLKNPSHERFAQIIAIGDLSNQAAYIEAFGPFKKDGSSLAAPAAFRLILGPDFLYPCGNLGLLHQPPGGGPR